MTIQYSSRTKLAEVLRSRSLTPNNPDWSLWIRRWSLQSNHSDRTSFRSSLRLLRGVLFREKHGTDISSKDRPPPKLTPLPPSPTVSGHRNANTLCATLNTVTPRTSGNIRTIIRHLRLRPNQFEGSVDLPMDHHKFFLFWWLSLMICHCVELNLWPENSPQTEIRNLPRRSRKDRFFWGDFSEGHEGDSFGNGTLIDASRT